MNRRSSSAHITDEIRLCLNDLERVKNLDLSPSHHHYLVLHHLYRWMREIALPHARGVLLDYGCGGRPYESLFTPNVEKYIAADVATAANTCVDILLEPDCPVPLPDASLDTLLANQTLEHVSNPSFYISECYRLLRPGGFLILSAPMQWRHHEAPFDYHRFTRYGIEHYLKMHSFIIKNMCPCGGAYALLGQIWLNHLSQNRKLPKWTVRLINSTFLNLDHLFPDSDETINWMCLAQKPNTHSPP